MREGERNVERERGRSVEREREEVKWLWKLYRRNEGEEGGGCRRFWSSGSSSLRGVLNCLGQGCWQILPCSDSK